MGNHSAKAKDTIRLRYKPIRFRAYIHSPVLHRMLLTLLDSHTESDLPVTDFVADLRSKYDAMLVAPTPPSTLIQPPPPG